MSTHAFVKLSRALIRDLLDRLGLESGDLQVKATDLDLNCLCTALGEHLRYDYYDLVAPPNLPKRLHVELTLCSSVIVSLTMSEPVSQTEEHVRASRALTYTPPFRPNGSARQYQMVDVFTKLLLARGVVFVEPTLGYGFVPVNYKVNIDVMKEV